MEIIFFIEFIFLVFSLWYVYQRYSGIVRSIPFKHIEGLNKLNKGIDVKISFNKYTIKIDDIIIPISRIDRLETISSKELVEENGGNVVANAVLGGILMGGVGAVVGGMSGVGTKKVTKLIYYLTIFFKDNTYAIFSFDGYSNKFGMKNAFKRINKGKYNNQGH